MEALHGGLTSGGQSGAQEQCEREPLPTPAPPKQPQQQNDSSRSSHGAPQQSKQSRRQLPERKRLRAQRHSVDSDTNAEHKEKETKTVPESELSPASAATKTDPQEGTPKQKRERKPQKPGKYVCTYCGRACAKPSVLQKHIRSHTGERPYPCPPCGFSFKTKSNLYKHRKSHTHRVKAGLASQGEQRSTEEQVTESEDEARHLSSAASLASLKNLEANQVKDCTSGHENSYAVRKRLAMRLSRGKDALKDSTDDKKLSLILGSKESTESGYFSRSESMEQSQDVSPNTSAKSYAEIILGKYGRLGHLQRMSRQNNNNNSGDGNQQSADQDEKTVPFTLPKKQVIDHITKLITINEAVVDTSKIDSVKPRRFSLSRKNSESQKTSAVKEAYLQIPKPTELLYKSSGSITMGVPCEKFQQHSSNVGQTASAPLLRSHSMPTAATSRDIPAVGSNKSRLTQSFDEREPSESQVPRRYGMLRRQPAIDGDPDGSHAFFSDCLSIVPDHKQTQPQPYECESCGTGCKDWEGYKKHRQTVCVVHRPRNEVVVSQMECSQIVTQSARPGMLALRKRRKAESFELEDPTSPTSPTSVSSCPSAEQCNFPGNISYEAPRRQIQTCSVIQHTSSFEKQESLSECLSSEPAKDSPVTRDQEISQKQPPELSAKAASLKKLVRQHNVHKVPEILVTEDSNASPDNLPESSTTTTKQQQQLTEKCEEFPWRQRGSSLAQLPIEKLPPKKKRLRLAEAAQSSGESSFESVSLPLSPGQESSASFASSRSTSFEESNRFDLTETMTSTSTMRRSRAPQMLTVPGVHQREMRRSASEQAPHDPQPQNVSLVENRSKSFDYSSLSPERSAIGWRERRKCLLIRHTAVRDPDEEDLPSSLPHSSDKVISSPQKTSSMSCSKPSSSPSRGETTSQDISHPWKQQNVKFPEEAKEDALKIFTNQISSPSTSLCSTHGLSGAARAHYQPVSTGLKLEILPGHGHSGSSHVQSAPLIVSSVERVQPNTSTAVVVRFQTDTLTPACAIYTTLSQSSSSKPLEAVDAGSHTVDMSVVEGLNRELSGPQIPVWSDDPRASGSGGNKRMLSPSNSIELSPQQQQKRVKEDEVHDGHELVPEAPRESPTVSQAALQKCGASFPSMLSSTSNSWCYLNYVKPNPATLDQQKTSVCSVYSSWSTSGYDPNPPGLSSKTALSLLHCKQRLSPSIYTTSSMSLAEETKDEPRSPQMYIKTSCSDSSSDQQQISNYSSKASAEEQATGPDSWSHKSRSRSKDCGPDRTEDSHKDLCVQSVCPSDARSNEIVREQTTVTSSAEAPQSHDHTPDVEPFASDHLKSSKNSSCIDVNQTVRPPCAIADSKGPDSENVSDPAHLSPVPTSHASVGPAPAESTQRTSASVRRALFARRRFTPTAPPTSPPSPPQATATLSTATLVTPTLAMPTQATPALATPTPACSSPRCHVNTNPPRCLLPTIAPPPKTDARPLGNGPGNPSDPTHPKAPPTAPHPCRSRPAHNLLSHLPLHSQRSEATPTLLIPIGGIHMIQPRACTMRLLSPTMQLLSNKLQQSDSASDRKLPPSPPPQSHAPKAELTNRGLSSTTAARKQKVD